MVPDAAAVLVRWSCPRNEAVLLSLFCDARRRAPGRALRRGAAHIMNLRYVEPAVAPGSRAAPVRPYTPGFLTKGTRMTLESGPQDPEIGCVSVDADGTIVLDEMVEKATSAANFLKALAHEGRLMILCHLSQGEKSVTELERLLCARQAAVSQQLARLRLEGLVSARRDGKAIYYSVCDPRAQRLIELVYDMFCNTAADA